MVARAARKGDAYEQELEARLGWVCFGAFEFDGVGWE
jgi:hypothetical protein